MKVLHFGPASHFNVNVFDLNHHHVMVDWYNRAIHQVNQVHAAIANACHGFVSPQLYLIAQCRSPSWHDLDYHFWFCASFGGRRSVDESVYARMNTGKGTDILYFFTQFERIHGETKISGFSEIVAGYAGENNQRMYACGVPSNFNLSLADFTYAVQILREMERRKALEEEVRPFYEQIKWSTE